MATTTRAHIYCRVSSTGQEDGYSLDTQEQECRTWCAERELTVASVAHEVWSGADRRRPELNSLLDRLLPGDVLLSHDLDRLSRGGQVDTAIIIDRIESVGASVAFVTLDFDKSETGALLRNVRAFAAALEREKLSERTVRGRIARVQSGKLIPGGRPPYGYRWRDETKGQLDEDPTTAPVARRMFAAIAGGMSLGRLAASLMQDGIPTPTGKGVWHASTLSSILHHPAYQGDAFGWGIRKAGVRPQWFDPEKAIRLPDGTIPPLVERSTWAAVQAVLQRNKAQSIRSAKNPEAALLRGGFVRCGTCGRVMKVRPRSNGGVDYYCTGNNSLPCARPTSIMGSVLDPAVWGRVRAVIVDPATVAREVERLRGNDPTADDLRAVRRLVAEVERQRANLTNAVAMLDDPDAAAPLVAQLRALAERRRALDTEEAALAQRQAAWQSVWLDVGTLAKWCATVSGRVDTLTWRERRTALSALGVSATIYPHGHEPRYIIEADINMQTLSNTT
jgi:site-specific DNA recombinase